MNYLALLLVTFLIVLSAIAAMSIGVLFGRQALSGSCGGVGANGKCPRCTGDGVCKKRRLPTSKGDRHA